MKPPAWFTGDADVWCRTCAARRFGPGFDGIEPVNDSEGNPVSPVYSWEESEWEESGLAGYPCGGGCGDTIN